nr:M48 family metallopeptidase [Neisseria meningitidis]
MKRFTYTLSDGLCIEIELKRSAKKNLILRPVNMQTVSINVPPFFQDHALANWLAANETILRNTLAKTPVHPVSHPNLPEWIWYRGIKTKLDTHSQSHIRITSSEILLPRKETAAQIDHLRRLLNERAREYLLPRLEKHAAETGLTPTATDLSNAKTFWGVCRPHTGIRLNWRLIGAPKYVADYVCIHELCHLRHPDHSPRFWHLVNTLTPHTDNAKSWLKAHGRELCWGKG